MSQRSGFQFINATLNADGSNFMYIDKTPVEPKLVTVGELRQFPICLCFRLNGMRLAQFSPRTAAFSAVCIRPTLAWSWNLNTQNSQPERRFGYAAGGTSPTSPDALDNQTNLPAFTFYGQYAGARSYRGRCAAARYVLEGLTAFPTPCTAPSAAPLWRWGLRTTLTSQTKGREHSVHTLVFPEIFLTWGRGIYSDALRFSVAR